MMTVDHSETIKIACEHISSNNLEQAEQVIKANYPFAPVAKTSRSYTSRQMTKIFLRDGFIDRYKGTRLVYPPALRLISEYLPSTFPYHKNGKMDEGHMAYWELFPTIDHIHPVALGGSDDEQNWVCCSMLTNGIKSNWTLEQLGWELLEPGKIEDWDGMIEWFIERVQSDPQFLERPYFKNWFNAAMDITGSGLS